VKGVGGSIIHAIGIGSIKLMVARGAHILLENVLFIPSATIRLISVSAICRGSKLTAHLDEFSCWLTKKSGAKIASGVLGKTRSLYSLTSSNPSVEHAYFSQRIPNLETWHRRLGHTNYTSIVNMARKGLVEGMPIDLSTEPPKCQHCILGKQTKSLVPKIREGEK